MILRVTEVNAWERERWSYILDADKQGAYAINQLLLFARLANTGFDKIHENHKGEPFAASRYIVEFFDKYEINEHGTTILINDKSRLHMNERGNYKSGGLLLEKRLSPRRLHSAVVQLRDKKENVVYKNFESLFLANG